MQTTKILTALMIGFVGFWGFTQFGDSQARHILVTDTAAYVMDNGMIAVTFSVENNGAPDRILSARSGRTEAQIQQLNDEKSIVVPLGNSQLSLESAHIQLASDETPPETGTLLPLTMTLESKKTINAFIRVAESGKTPALHGTMLHGAMQIDMGDPPPEVTVDVSPSDAGWVLSIDTQNFEFDRDAVDGNHVPGMGHGHLYVGGTKIGRVYQNTVTVGELPKGKHLVRVTLNTNNHISYVNDGKVVSATAVIEVD